MVPKADSGARGLPLSGSRTGELQGGDTDKSPEEILKQALQNAQVGKSRRNSFEWGRFRNKLRGLFLT